MIKIMKHCGQCDRELAESFETCPFCKGDLEVREIEEHEETEEERKARLERVLQARIKKKKQQKILAIAMCVLVLFGVISTTRFADSALPMSGEWFLTRLVKRSEGPTLPSIGIITSQKQLDEWQKTYKVEFLESIDFKTTTLVYMTTAIENALAQGQFLEKITANFMNTWALYSQGKPFGDIHDHMGWNHARGESHWVQGVHMIAVTGKLSSVPKMERTGTDFSRRPPE